MKGKLLLIGWDAADWQVINPLLEAGKMPALKRLIDSGVWGFISTLDPPISPMLWTTIATGLPPEKHGIVGFIEPDPEGKGVRPLTSTSRKVKAIWNILNQQGGKSNVVGWWPSFPAEPINGVMVSNFYQMITDADRSKWPIPEGTIHPPEFQEILKEYRIHTEELTPAHLMPFAPFLPHTNLEKDNIPSLLAKQIAHNSSIHAAGTYLLENTDWNFTGIYYDLIDHMCHLAMKFRAPQMEGVPDDKFMKYREVVDAAYIFQDMMLERKLELIDDDTAVMILSDHGFYSGNMRPRILPMEPAGPTAEHNPFGMFVLSGPGIKKGERIYGASLYDIAPTILHYYGLPVGKDMPGKCLAEAFVNPIHPEFIDSWENQQTGDSGMHPENRRIDSWESMEALNQLIELGYVDRPDPDNEKAVLQCRSESLYYLARSLLFDRQPEKAVPLLEQALELRPGLFRYQTLYAQCLIRINDHDKAIAIADQLIEYAEKEIDPDNIRYKTGKSYGHYLRGLSFHRRYRAKEAIENYTKALEFAPDSIEIALQLANINLTSGRYSEAKEGFRNILDRNEQQINALYGLGLAELKSGNAEEATDYFLDAIDIRMAFPQAHYYLGESLLQLKDYQSAVSAFSTALKFQPGMLRAHERLFQIYSRQLPDPSKADYHKNILATKRKGELLIISGLHSSGYQQLADELAEQGLTIARPQSSEEIDQQEGWQVCLSSWLPSLPAEKRIRLIWTDRNWGDMLKEQLNYTDSGLAARKNAYPLSLEKSNKEHLQIIEDWIFSRPEIDLLRINYDDLNDKNSQSRNALLNYLGL